jgi:hypothetical protein
VGCRSGQKLAAAEAALKQDLDMAAPRLRQRRDEQAKLTRTLAQLEPLDAPPKHPLNEATTHFFQDAFRDIVIPGDTPWTKAT